MSGYLQRLTSSVLNPGGSIRPILGSIYSTSSFPATREESVSSLIGTEDVGPAAARRVGLGRDSLDYPAPAEVNSINPLLKQTEEARAGGPVVPPDTGDHKGDRWSEENLAALNGQETVRTRHLAPEMQAAAKPPLPSVRPIFGRSREDGGSEVVSEPAGASAGTETVSSNDRIEPAQKIRYQPLIREAPSSTNDLQTFQKAWSPLTPSLQKENRGKVANGPRQPEREPDEIEIHIGRIEVTAVAQAAPRAPAAPARKSISLDEYLKRGERRSR